jgi:predicted SAM-dependent methyltransferase
VDLIYASHVLEYFDRDQAKEILTKWYSKLKPGGIIRLAVPNFEIMAKLYIEKGYSLSKFLGPLYGKMKMENQWIYHKTTYDFKELSQILSECGFIKISSYDWRNTEHSKFDDHSQAYIPHMDKENGTLISLNIKALK